MKYEDNDTLNANEQLATNNEKETSNGTKKIVAGMATSAVLGSAATYGAEVLLDKEEEQPVVADTEDKAETTTPSVEAKQEPTANAEEPAEQRIVIEHRDSAVHQTSSEESSFLTDNDIEISKIETDDVEGMAIHFASGTVNDHAAVIADDGQGNVIIAGIDQNDNGKLEENEIVDLRGENLSLGDVASRMTDEAPMVNVTAVTHEPDVHVVAVEHDVDVYGHAVDVAAVTVDDTPVILVDANQNGMADMALADVNGNGTLADDEFFDVRGSQIVMPTEAEATGTIVADESNDSDMLTFEV